MRATAMRIVILVFALSVMLAAQQAPGPRAGGAGQAGAAPGGRGGAPAAPAGKNLQVLPPNADVAFAMQVFDDALGVNCLYCHVQGDFASDANPKKDIARKMLRMLGQIDLSFPSSTGAFPAGFHEVDCTTCHRGSVKPETKTGPEFYNRGESMRGSPPPDPTPGVNVKVLPPDTQVHGSGGAMHEFRDSLGVDCSFCHGGGRPFEAEANPRKDIARNMLLMVRQINRNFPGTGEFPQGPLMVSCWTCHRGEPHPPNVFNKNYGPPKEPQQR
jgi:photosynthetic reaction center cytochrome c subunit